MTRFVLLSLAFVWLSCDEVSDDPHDRHFNILFRYGVGARNELNTFENTYTKDLILNGTVTIRFVLPVDDFYAIEGKVQALGFFGYPDTLRVTLQDSAWFTFHPYNTYFYRVQAGSKIKTLYWADSVMPKYYDIEYARWDKLQEFNRFVIDLIARQPKIQNLPPARGGYL